VISVELKRVGEGLVDDIVVDGIEGGTHDAGAGTSGGNDAV
jgi:hypothetical protein